MPALPVAFTSAYLQNLADCAELIDGAKPLLRALHPRYRLAILTNGLKAVQRSRLALAGIRDYISELIISEKVGAAESDPAIFDAALARLSHPPKAAVLMIGDSLTSDIQGALRYGLDTCWYNPGGKPRPGGMEPRFEIQTLSQLEVAGSARISIAHSL